VRHARVARNAEATTIAGQATLLRETGLEYVGRMLLFRPLPEWGGMISVAITAGAVGQASFVSWVTLIGLMCAVSRLANLLPVPCLAVTGSEFLYHPL
jgi:ABC-type dipeptide/oligopeptide/nickel transport system permease subunit